MKKGQPSYRVRARTTTNPDAPGCDICGRPVVYRDTLPSELGSKPLHRAYCRNCAPPYDARTGTARQHRWQR